MIVQCFSRAFIQQPGDLVEFSLSMLRQVSSSRKELAQESVGVLVRSALPGALRIAEVDLDVGLHTEPLMIRHFVTAIPSECFVEFRWQPLGLFDESVHDSFCMPVR